VTPPLVDRLSQADELLRGHREPHAVMGGDALDQAGQIGADLALLMGPVAPNLLVPDGVEGELDLQEVPLVPAGWSLRPDVQDRGQDLFRGEVLACAQSLDPGREPTCMLFVQLDHQVVQRGEVRVEGAAGEPGAFTDVFDAGAVEPLLGEHLQRYLAGHGRQLWGGPGAVLPVPGPVDRRICALSPGQAPLVAGAGCPRPVRAGPGRPAFAVVFFGLGIQVEHPAAVLALMSFTSIVFVAILRALVARLGAVGTFLGLVLMVVQLVSAGGTFPWQTLPEPLSALHHVLPMGYAVDGIRRLMYGGSWAPVGADLAVLSAYLLLALAASTFAARRARVWTPARVKPELAL
jgi:hypothetical protein